MLILLRIPRSRVCSLFGLRVGVFLWRFSHTCYFDATDDRYHPCLAGQSYQEEPSGKGLRVERLNDRWRSSCLEFFFMIFFKKEKRATISAAGLRMAVFQTPTNAGCIDYRSARASGLCSELSCDQNLIFSFALSAKTFVSMALSAHKSGMKPPLVPALQSLSIAVPASVHIRQPNGSMLVGSLGVGFRAAPCTGIRRIFMEPMTVERSTSWQTGGKDADSQLHGG